MTDSLDPWVLFVNARLDEDEQHANDQHHRQCAGFGEPEFLFLDPGLCDCGVPDTIREWCEVGRRLVVGAVGDHDLWLLMKLAWPYRRHPDHPGGET